MDEQEWQKQPTFEEAVKMVEQVNYNVCEIYAVPTSKYEWRACVKIAVGQAPLCFTPERADELATEAERNSQHDFARRLRAAAHEARLAE